MLVFAHEVRNGQSMAKDDLSGKLAVILHADVVASTQLVQQNEQLAHQRIQDAFRHFSDSIGKYHGRVQELRGDALLAEFERPSDAVTAALSFQSEHRDRLAQYDDDIRPQIRIGIALGEVVITDRTVTGAGVVLAQRIEQLAEAGGLCITSAIHEALPNRMPFCLDSLGEQSLKGFDDPVRVYQVQLSPGESVPLPQSKGRDYRVGDSFRQQRTMDGKVTHAGVNSPIDAVELDGEVAGESWIEDDRLCDRWTDVEGDLTLCVLIFRDPDSGQNNYYMMTDTGPHPFQVQN